AAALPSNVLVRLLEIPKPAGPSADETLPRYQRPVFLLNQRPQFGAKPVQAYRTRVPAELALLDRLNALLAMSFRDLRTALRDGPLAVRRDELLASLDQRGQRRLGIRSDIQIHISAVMPEVLNVALQEQIHRRDVDGFRAARVIGPRRRGHVRH